MSRPKAQECLWYSTIRSHQYINVKRQHLFCVPFSMPEQRGIVPTRNFKPQTRNCKEVFRHMHCAGCFHTAAKISILVRKLRRRACAIRGGIVQETLNLLRVT